MKHAVLLLATPILLIGCGTATSGSPETRALVLPEIKGYSSDQQMSLANEMEQCNFPATSMMFHKDYDTMQRETRIALKGLEKD